MSNLCRVCSCTEFVAHAFLKQKCINCNHTLVQHQPEGAETDKSNPSTPSSNNAGSVSLASPSSTSVGRLPFSSPSKQQQQPSLPSPSSANSAPTATGNATNPVNTAAAEIAAASAPAPNVPLPPPPRKGSLPPPLPPFLRSGSPTSSSSPATGPAVPPPPPPAQALPPPVTPTNTNAGNGTATPSTSSAAQATAAAAAAAAAAATSSSAAPPRPPPRPSLTGTQISAGISGTFPAASALRPPPTPPTTSIPTTVVPPPLNTASSPSPPPLSVTGTVEPSLAVATPSPSPSPFAPFSPAAISPSMNQTPAASASVAAAGAATNSALSLPPTPSNPRASVADKKPPPPPPMPRSVSAPDDNTTPVAPVAATTTAATTTTATAAPTPSKEPRGSATWIDPNYRPSFAQKLHHKFDVVVEQSNNGMRLLKRVRAFMTRFSKLQEHYATELQKITSVERNKLIAMQRPDMMISCYTSWLGFFENMDELSRANLEFSQELKEVTVEQLEKWYGIGGTMVKEQKQEQERVHQAMLKVNIAVVKERDIANQSLQKLATKRGTGIDTDTPSSSSGSGGEKSGETKKGSNFMDSIFKNSNPQKSFEKSREAAIKACENYSQTLTQSNISHAKYHQDELPAMMTQMQSLEEMRLHSLSSALRDFSRMQKTFMESLKKISNSIQEYSAGVDANADIANYVDRVCMEHGPALPPVPFTYDLPLSVAELKSMTFDEPPSSLFYSTLDGVMKHQKGMEATMGTTASTVAASSSTTTSATGSTSTGNGGAISTRPIALELPLIVPTLLRGIYENGGMTSEGIFRISVGSEELTRSRRQLESGDYTLKETNPHVFACLLKSWFRDLLAPVFPYDSYAKCIAIGSIEPYTPATHALQIKSLMADLPPLNEKILAVLFGFLKKLSGNTEYVSKTRMNLANLSLVFSPGLVRSEKNDPLQMLQDTKYASNFVYRAIEATPQCFRDDAQKFSNQLLEEIFAANVNPR